MFKKKYGRMTVGAWLGSEMEQTTPALMIVLGAVMMIGGIIVRLAVGSPHMMLLALNVSLPIPPVWLMTLLWSLAFLTVGCAAGFVLGFRAGGCDVDKYKGGMLFILLAVLEFCWYPTFFGAGLIFLSVLESILILCLAVGVTLCFYRVSKFAGMLVLLHVIWLIYMLILNFAVFFCC
ncbi:MAG: tryptophan-rich sensory protein [Clostridia bacterium]|nr:tryptophan-rich sensory protein [Clostridia bacterium]